MPRGAGHDWCVYRDLLLLKTSGIARVNAGRGICVAYLGTTVYLVVCSRALVVRAFDLGGCGGYTLNPIFRYQSIDGVVGVCCGCYCTAV